MKKTSTEVNHHKAFILEIQHLLAMYSGAVAVPLLIGTALQPNDIPSFNRYFYVWTRNFFPTRT